ncbi:hypothetical protein [Dictyobacter vulcani]|nr:hypothetical protein [Dictyobacter vulcani]
MGLSILPGGHEALAVDTVEQVEKITPARPLLSSSGAQRLGISAASR